MRGKGPYSNIAPMYSRITPAYAGKSITHPCACSTCGDHPRICGEKIGLDCIVHCFQGSPPHMRGKGPACSRAKIRSGITPAYAGKRNCRVTLSATVRDHPRICGEKALVQIIFFFQEGSPPHMRGKEKPRHVGGVEIRITPAYAGKRLLNSPYTTLKRDHPRICGEKSDASMKKTAQEGSPPHMRGKEALALHPLLGRRITPAYAGKSRHTLDTGARLEDHPRICGEKTTPI